PGAVPPRALRTVQTEQAVRLRGRHKGQNITPKQAERHQSVPLARAKRQKNRFLRPSSRGSPSGLRQGFECYSAISAPTREVKRSLRGNDLDDFTAPRFFRWR